MRKPTVMPASAPSNPIWDQPQSEAIFGAFSIRKVVTTHHVVKASEAGFKSFGAMLDAHLEEAAMAHEEVQSVEFEMNPEHWQHFARQVQTGGVPTRD